LTPKKPVSLSELYEAVAVIRDRNKYLEGELEKRKFRDEEEEKGRKERDEQERKKRRKIGFFFEIGFIV